MNPCSSRHSLPQVEREAKYGGRHEGPHNGKGLAVGSTGLAVSWLLAPGDVALFGNWVFADVIKMTPDWIGVALSQ